MNVTMSEEEDMEEVEMEDVGMDEVDIEPHAYADLYHEHTPGPHEPKNAIEITLSKPKETPKRKAPIATPQDRKNRVLIHQIHVVTILAAARLRNQWCNDLSLRNTLQDMVPDILLRKLQAIQPRHEPERRQRVRMFEAFMTDLIHWWHDRFHVHTRVATAAAWRQPSIDTFQPVRIPPNTWVDGWIVESPSQRMQRHKQEARHKLHPATEVSIFPPGAETSTPTYLCLLPPPEICASPTDLVAAAHAQLGSRETKAILFCALCRSLGVPARLVVSPQVSSYTFSQSRPKPIPDAAAEEEEEEEEEETLYIEPLDEKAPPTVWVEVYSKPYQHWLTVDPVRGFLKATGLRNMEPHASQRQNKLVYVVAFEEDGYARDVTARYTRQLHTRVARMRPSGRHTDWWARVVRALHRPQKLDRDAVEDVELQDQARREPMPTSAGAFKDHPVYVLERHLHRDQVIHPPHRVGTFQGQPVYLRAHVVQLRSARQWYNVGRDVKPGEEPLKWTKQRSYTTTGKRLEEQVRATTGEDAMEGLFAEFQTRLYSPPPVVDGHVPRNAFGNVDLFVPTMLPAGGTHVAHHLAARAAKQLNVSFADAVVGFEFRRFRSLPKLNGIVVPTASASLVWDAIRQLEAHEVQNERAKVQKRAWKNWDKLITALLVSRRVQDEYKSVLTVPEPQPEQAPPEESGTRQLRDVPELEPEPGPEPESKPAPSAPEPRAPHPSGPIVSLDEMIAAESPPPTPPRRRIVLVRRHSPPRRRQSSRQRNRARPSYAEDDD